MGGAVHLEQGLPNVVGLRKSVTGALPCQNFIPVDLHVVLKRF
jgi:hypothetical protein